MKLSTTENVQYPLGTLIPYGPTPKHATKLAAAVIPAENANATALKRWHVKSGDIRTDTFVKEEIALFFAGHNVRTQLSAPDIMGCEHEEGIDHPLGAYCTECSLWAALEAAKSPLTGKSATGNGAFIEVDEIIQALSDMRGCPPKEAFAAADARRDELMGPLLSKLNDLLDRAMDETGGSTSQEDNNFAAHALLLLAKWRDPSAFPLVARWHTAPESAMHSFAWDTQVLFGSSILASVSQGNTQAIRAIVEDRTLDELARANALTSLAIRVAWGEDSREEFASYLQELITENLERETNYVWGELACLVANFRLGKLVPLLVEPYEKGWIASDMVAWAQIETAKLPTDNFPVGNFKTVHYAITDLVEPTATWDHYQKKVNSPSIWLKRPAPAQKRRPKVTAPAPHKAELKIGRNDPCPCGSSKKYKKCCGIGA